LQLNCKLSRSYIGFIKRSWAFRAYAGTYDPSEDGIEAFAKNSANYFKALRSGDSKEIEKEESNFRLALYNLAETITGSGHGYIDSAHQKKKYNETHQAAPLFDKFTKKDHRKN
jgi:hypothetical protein